MDRQFVICLISRGNETGSDATPYRVGTLVQYDHAQKSGDVLLIKPKGNYRLYLEKFDRESHPYLSAECSPYPDEQEDVSESLLVRMDALEKKIALMADSGEAMQATDIHQMLRTMRKEFSLENYSLFLCGCLDLPHIYRQHLLESRSLAYRVENTLRLLSRNSE